MPKRIVIAGGSGFMGRSMQDRWRAAGHDVRTIGRRNADADWSSLEAIAGLVDGADVLIGLAGRSVNCRYNDHNRNEILSSRIDTTTALHRAVQGAKNPPRVWFNASTATLYPHSTERPNTEASPISAKGFSEDVARRWEAAFFDGETPGTRRVAMRTTIALGDDGDATKLLFTLARLGLGGQQYDGWWFPHTRYRALDESTDDPKATAPSIGRPTHGLQRFSWIHVDDLVRAVEFVEARDDIEGPVNFASPRPGTNRSLMAALRNAVGAPFGLPAARWMLEPAMWALRTESELILKSRWVLPGVLEAAGFEFQHPDLDFAILEIWRSMQAEQRAHTR